MIKQNLHIDSIVKQYMCLETLETSQYKLTILNLRSYRIFFIIVQHLFIISTFTTHLCEAKQASYILCLNETKIQNICRYQEI
jgi:hypothetical protein